MGIFSKKQKADSNSNSDQLLCPNCGYKLNPGDQFCTNCGQKVTTPNVDGNSSAEDEKAIVPQSGPNSPVSVDAFMSVDFLPVQKANEILHTDYISYPLGSIASFAGAAADLGGVFASLSQMGAHSGNLFRVTFDERLGPLVKAKNQGPNAYRAMTSHGGQFTSQAVLRPDEAEHVQQLASNASSMCMAIALAAINQTLGEVLKAQKDIINFLEVDKQAKLKSELIALTDIMQDYHLNKDNPAFISNREHQVAEVRRDAEQNIIFYKDRIDQQFLSQPLFHVNTEKTANDIQGQFKLYQLALYLYSFASFMDIMLLENFKEEYLQAVEKKIADYISEFDEFYNSTCEKLDHYVRTSVQSTLVKGISIASSKVGDVVGSTDRFKSIDKSLHAGGQKLKDFNDTMNQRTISVFFENNDSGIEMFRKNISLVNMLYNHPLEMVIYGDDLYVKEIGTND